jgi:hypothetical protein
MFGTVFSMLSDKIPDADSEYAYAPGKHSRLRLLQPQDIRKKEEVTQDMLKSDSISVESTAMMFSSIRDKNFTIAKNQTAHKDGVLVEDTGVDDRVRMPALQRRLQEHARTLTTVREEKIPEQTRTNLPTSHVQEDMTENKRHAYYKIRDNKHEQNKRVRFAEGVTEIPSTDRGKHRISTETTHYQLAPRNVDYTPSSIKYSPGIYNLNEYHKFSHGISHDVRNIEGGHGASTRNYRTESIIKTKPDISAHSHLDPRVSQSQSPGIYQEQDTRISSSSSNEMYHRPERTFGHHEPGQYNVSDSTPKANRDTVQPAIQATTVYTASNLISSEGSVVLKSDRGENFRMNSSDQTKSDMDNLLKQYMNARDPKKSDSSLSVGLKPELTTTNEEQFQESITQIFKNNKHSVFDIHSTNVTTSNNNDPGMKPLIAEGSSEHESMIDIKSNVGLIGNVDGNKPNIELKMEQSHNQLPLNPNVGNGMDIVRGETKTAHESSVHIDNTPFNHKILHESKASGLLTKEITKVERINNHVASNDRNYSSERVLRDPVPHQSININDQLHEKHLRQNKYIPVTQERAFYDSTSSSRTKHDPLRENIQSRYNNPAMNTTYRQIPEVSSNTEYIS